MPEYSIFQNITGATDSYGTEANPWNFGVRFHPTVDGYITALRWWKGQATVDNHRPDAMVLWDDANRAAIAQAVPPQFSSGNDNWRDYVLISPLFVPAGKVLCISAHYPGSAGAVWGRWFHTIASLPVIPDVFSLEISPTVNKSGATAYPDVVGATNITLLDVVFDTEYSPNPTTPVTSGSLAAELAEWLDTEAQTHELTGIPALSWDLLQTMETVIDATKAKLDGVDAALELALGPLGNLATGALRGFLDDLSGKIDDVQAAVGPFINDHTTAAKTEILTAIDSLPTGGGGLVPLFDGGLSWTQADQTVGQ